jgi:hypothetical protein
MIRQLDSSGEWELRQLFAHSCGRVGHSDGNPIVGLIRPQTGNGPPRVAPEARKHRRV